MSNLKMLVEEWRQQPAVVVLTGAGISTASGIPDFRSPGGRWESYQPVMLQEFMASEAKREEYWRYKRETWEVICEAEPNPAHVALTALAQGGRLGLLVTQNIDGLHQRSGFPEQRLIQIHGTDATVECMTCHDRRPRVEIDAIWKDAQQIPYCSCGGPLKPATISFGQNLVAADLEHAMGAAAECDLFVAIGSSLVVSPINQMFAAAKAGGAATAILTASETPFDSQADFKFSDPLEDILPELRDAILSDQP